MPYRRSPEKFKRWFCPICQSDITWVHKKRHIDSEGHQRRAFWLSDPKDSDIEFARFLIAFDARNFAGVERKIYESIKAGRSPSWSDGASIPVR